MTPPRAILIAIAVALIAAEIARPTHVPQKRLVSRSLVLGPSLFGAEMLDDLPRIHPDALGIIARPTLTNDGSQETLHLHGWIADPYTLAAGLTVFAFENETRIPDATVRYHLPSPEIARETGDPKLAAVGFEIVEPWHGPLVRKKIQVGLITPDQRGFFVLPNVRQPGAQITPSETAPP